MSFLSRNKDKPLIPPVQRVERSRSPGDGRPPIGDSGSYRSYHSNASTYVPSRDGDPYNVPSSQAPSYQGGGYASPPAVDRYNKIGVGDPYSRSGRRVEDDRSELFAGYNPERPGPGRFVDGPDLGREPPRGEETEEDVEGIKQQTRYIKQDSVNSTRNALRMAREAEETARGTLGRLGDQSEKLANTERHLDIAKGHSQRADDRTDELKKLNRSIFRPVITFNKEGKRIAQEAKIQAQYEEEREEREKGMQEVRDTQERLGRAVTYGRPTGDEELIGGSGGPRRGQFGTAQQQEQRKEQRKRYQFEATASDDELEDELDANLDEVSEATKRLKALGMTMGQELDQHNSRIGRIEEKTVKLDNRVFRNTERLKKIK